MCYHVLNITNANFFNYNNLKRILKGIFIKAFSIFFFSYSIVFAGSFSIKEISPKKVICNEVAFDLLIKNDLDLFCNQFVDCKDSKRKDPKGDFLIQADVKTKINLEKQTHLFTSSRELCEKMIGSINKKLGK